MRRFVSSSALPSLFAVGSFVLAGCAAGHAWVGLLTAALWVAGLALSGCGDSHRRAGHDAGTSDARTPTDALPDTGTDAGGYWEPCCEGGVISSCFCAAGWACNYGWFTDCGDGTCEDPGSGTMCEPDGGHVDPPDAGPPDAGGYWEPCCIDGMVDTCFCPAGLACNYGWYTDCGDGTCIEAPGSTCTVDAGAGG
jgi:predicted small secreted protein